MANKKRLYFALWPTAEIREAIFTGTARAIEGAGDAGAVPPANYHLTLAFLGAVSASSVPDMISMVRRVRFLPFIVPLERTGYWPRSQVAWVAPASCPPRLYSLVDDLWNKLGDMGFSRDERPFLPHVTIGRNVGDSFATPMAQPINWPVGSFTLLESETHATGPVYTVLEEFYAGD